MAGHLKEPNFGTPSMDFTILLCCPWGLQAEQLTVRFCQKFDRQPHPDASLEASIEQVWQERTSQQPSLFNGLKFRYAGFSMDSGGTYISPPPPVSQKTPTEICLHLGLTDYKTFIGTNLHPQWPRFLPPHSPALSPPCPPPHEKLGTEKEQQQEGEGDEQAEEEFTLRHLANPLGNAIIVVLEQGEEEGRGVGEFVWEGDARGEEKEVEVRRGGYCSVLVLDRGSEVGEAPNQPVFPGGHPEPSEVGIHGHRTVHGEKKQEDGEEGDPDNLGLRISAEMFLGMLREVEEETGVPAGELRHLRFLGLVRRTDNVRPISVFSCTCSLSFPSIQSLYERASHRFESTGLRAVPINELLQEADRMPGCHMGAAALFVACEKERMDLRGTKERTEQ